MSFAFYSSLQHHQCSTTIVKLPFFIHLFKFKLKFNIQVILQAAITTCKLILLKTFWCDCATFPLTFQNPTLVLLTSYWNVLLSRSKWTKKRSSKRCSCFDSFWAHSAWMHQITPIIIPFLLSFTEQPCVLNISSCWWKYVSRICMLVFTKGVT